MRTRLFISLLLCLCVPGFSVPAKETNDTTDTTLQELTVTAGRDKVSKSAVPMQSLTKEEIRLRGITDISDALRRMSGVNLRDYGGAGGMKTVSLRGLGAQHTGVTYDGMALSEVRGGQIDLSRFSLGNIDAIDIIAGESDDIFLPARVSSSASLLSIKSIREEDLYGPPFHIRAGVKAGSWNHWNPFFSLSQAFREKVAVSLSGDFIHARNDYPFTLQNGAATERLHRSNSMINSGYGEANVLWRPRTGQTIRAKAYYYNSGRHLPGPVTYYNPVSHERLNESNAFGQAGWLGKLSDKVSMQANAKFNWSYTRYRDENGRYPNGILDNQYWQRETYASAAVLYRPVKGLQLDYSADWFYNNLSSNSPNDNRPFRNSILQVIAAKYKVWRFSVTGKLLYSIYLNRAKSGSQAKDAKRLSPSLSLSLQPLAGTQWLIRASYKNIFRMPTFNELYFDHYGSVNLNPETTEQLNFGMTWNSGRIGPLTNLSVTADGYLNFVKNKIVAMPYNMFVMTMTNLGKVRICGADVTLNATFALTQSQNLILSGNYSYQRAQPRTDPLMLDWMKQVAYTPLNSGAASLTWENPWVTAVVHTSGCSARYSTNINSPDTRIAGYMELGFALMHEFRFLGNSLEIRADLINALDKQYCLIARYPMPGRAWLATITYKL